MLHSLWILHCYLSIKLVRRITLKTEKGQKERKETGRMSARRKRRTKETFRTMKKYITKRMTKKNSGTHIQWLK
jgi:hypothetical protein